MADDRRVPENPRSPEHHGQTGSGTSRSADDGLPQEGAHSDAADTDTAVTTAATSTSQPASTDEMTINRSGSGGSGGPATPDDTVEGSSGSSMSELLAGEEQTLEDDLAP